MKEVRLPLDEKTVENLGCGERILLSGYIYTARDAAHKRMIEAIANGEELPFPVKDSVIYYAGPTPAPPGKVAGSFGPTTSCRMDAYAPILIEKGLRGMIGKGERDKTVVDAMKKHGCVYLGAIGGAGALISKCIKSCEVVAYDDLGTEAIRRLKVENLPLVVAIDHTGKSLFDRQKKND